MAALFFLLLPFCQLGLSYYASVGTAMALMVVVWFRKTIIAGLSAHWRLCLPLAFMLPSLMTGEGADMVQDGLRVAREAIIFVMMIGVFNGARIRPPFIGARPLFRYSIILLGGLLGLAVIQQMGFARSQYIGIPAEFFSQGAGTIPTELALRYSHLRPSGTFSEPSYLSFVILSLAFALIPARSRRTGFAVAATLTLAIGLVSQALSFVVTAAMIVVAQLLRSGTQQRRAIVALTILICIPAVIVLGSNVTPIARILGGTSVSGDFSVFVRIFGPAQILPEFLLSHPFGVPFSGLEGALTPFADRYGTAPLEFLHNSIFALFFEYGVFAIFLLLAILHVRDATVRVYLVSCMLFNGAFLGPDKLAITGFAVCAHAAMSRRAVIARRLSRRRTSPPIPLDGRGSGLRVTMMPLEARP